MEIQVIEMLTRERFKEYVIEFLGYIDDFENLKSAETDITNHYSLPLDINYQTFVITLLAELMNDKFGWINWWINETDCGQDEEMISVKMSDGYNVSVGTLDDLYDIIVGNYK